MVHLRVLSYCSCDTHDGLSEFVNLFIIFHIWCGISKVWLFPLAAARCVCMLCEVRSIPCAMSYAMKYDWICIVKCAAVSVCVYECVYGGAGVFLRLTTLIIFALVLLFIKTKVRNACPNSKVSQTPFQLATKLNNSPKKKRRFC